MAELLKFDLSGPFRTSKDPSGPVRTRQDLSVSFKTTQDPSGFVRIHQESFKIFIIHKEQPEFGQNLSKPIRTLQDP